MVHIPVGPLLLGQAPLKFENSRIPVLLNEMPKLANPRLASSKAAEKPEGLAVASCLITEL
jgi:hypothetical protein